MTNIHSILETKAAESLMDLAYKAGHSGMFVQAGDSRDVLSTLKEWTCEFEALGRDFNDGAGPDYFEAIDQFFDEKYAAWRQWHR